MDNKFKKSKYAAIFLASTMALSTVVTAAPAAFDHNSITAHAEEVAAVTASEVTTAIAALNVADIATADTADATKTKYDVAVAAATTLYTSLSADEKAKVKAADVKKLDAHKAIVSGASAAIKALPTETSLKEKDENDVEKYLTYSSTGDKADTTVVKDKKGNDVTVGINKELETEVTKLAAFKTAYDKVVESNKETKALLKTALDTYNKALKVATAKQKTVSGTYDAIAFDTAYAILENGGKYKVTGKELKINKKGVFTIDGDKYTASKDAETGKFVITNASGDTEEVDDQGIFSVDNFDNEGDFIQSRFYGSGDDLESFIYLNNIKYDVVISGTKATLTATDKDTIEIENDTEVEANGRLYTAKVEADKVSLTLEKAESTFESEYKVEYVSNAFKVSPIESEITIKAPAKDEDKPAIKLLKLNKSMTVAGYKKLKAGKTKYNSDQITVINGIESEYKILSSEGKKTVTKTEVDNYKAYAADVKVQTALEKKLTSTDAKGVSDQINKLKYSSNTAAYADAIGDARYAYDNLTKKYQKKIKSSVVDKLKAQEKAIEIIWAINDLDYSLANLAKATTKAEVIELQQSVDAIAKTDKTNKQGGTGLYYSNLDKKERAYVKNFKQVAAINKLIVEKLAYVEQKTKVDVFEEKLTAVSGEKTIRAVGDLIVLGDEAYKATTDKKSKMISLSPLNSDSFVIQIPSNKTVNVAVEALNSIPERGEVIGKGTTENPYKVKIGETTVESGKDIIVGNFTFTVNIDKDGYVVFVGKELSGGSVITPTADKKITLGSTEYTVAIANGIATLTGPDAAEGETQLKVSLADKSTYTVGDKVYDVSVEAEKVTLTEKFSKGYVLTNAKGKLSASEKTALGTPVHSFKSMNETTFAQETTPKYTKEEIAAIAEATTAYTKLKTDKDANKQVNKIDTTNLKAYEGAVKAQQALEKKVLAKAVSSLKSSDAVTKYDENDKEIASTDTTTEVKTIVSNYELAVGNAKAIYDDFVAKYPALKDSTEKSYKTKLEDHSKAATVATKIVNLPKAEDATLVSEAGAKDAQKAYDALSAAQKKLLGTLGGNITAVTAKVAAIKDQNTAINEAKTILDGKEISLDTESFPTNLADALVAIKKLDTKSNKVITGLENNSEILVGSSDNKTITVKLGKTTALNEDGTGVTTTEVEATIKVKLKEVTSAD